MLFAAEHPLFGQQFQTPRIPGEASVPRSSLQVPAQWQSPRQTTATATPNISTYAPPVHVTPNNVQFSDETVQTSVEPNGYQQPARNAYSSRAVGTGVQSRSVGLQDRISQVLARQQPSARQLPRVSEASVERSARNQTNRGQSADQYQVRQGGRSPRVDQASMYSPMNDPFGDQFNQDFQQSVDANNRYVVDNPIAYVEESSQPLQRMAALPMQVPAVSPQRSADGRRQGPAKGKAVRVARQIAGNPVSVLNQSTEDSEIIEFTAEPELGPAEESFVSTRQPLQVPVEDGDTDLGTPNQSDQRNLRDQLDELMNETTNNLRKPASGKEQKSQDERRNESAKSLLDLEELEDGENNDRKKSSPLDKSCEDFRVELLNNHIRDISLDLSPYASELRNEQGFVARSWTDQSGNVIATGTMVDLRRGYVIIDTGAGQQKIAYARLSEADMAAVAEYWQIPQMCSVGNRGTIDRNWCPQTFTWTAASLCHKPLYFENIQLERYGHSHGPISQPFYSVGHFFVSLVTLPYQTAIHPANECQYALGFYRPGDCAPWLQEPIPISLNGMRRQAMVTTGLAFIP